MNNHVSTEDLLKSFIEIELPTPEHFLIVRETLTRMGVGSTAKKTISPSCVILHKQGKMYLLHFKEMFMLDRKHASFNEDDRKRRNTIAWLLSEWGLVKVKNTEIFKDLAPISSVKVVPAKEKNQYTITHKYTVGNN